MQQRDAGCPSDLRLDQWLAGELSRTEQAELEGHAASCAACQSRCDALVAARRSFAESAAPFAELARHAPSPRFAARKLVPLLAAAAALALVIGQPWLREGPSADGDGSGIRTKGGPAHLAWVVRRGERVFAGRPELALRAGDALRFTVSAREPVYLALFGRDAAGRLSVVHPESAELARLEPGSEQPLPVAIELDATPGDEQLYAVFCRSAVSLARVKEALERSLDAPALPAGCSLERQALHKEAP